MVAINSVLGPVHTEDLGFTLMHEHIMSATPGFFREYPEFLGDNVIERAVEDLKRAKAGGIDTIVDATTFDLGRDINILAEVSRQSGINIIACTGWFGDIPRHLTELSVDRWARAFIREIEEGISGTKIKAGILKAASDMQGVTPAAVIILRAVARAHLKTGVPIILHSYALGQVGRQQLAVLRQEGVDPTKVKLDHSLDTTDIEYLTWLLEQGCYLGVDRYPGQNPSPLARTKTMKTLIDAGYANRLCPSHDRFIVHTAHDRFIIHANDGIIIHASRINRKEAEAELLRLNPYGYLYIKKVVFPQLQEMGLTDSTINGLCVEGPRDFFEGV